MIGPRTIQLNTTCVSGKPATVRYAWKDYPNMIIYSADSDELPAHSVQRVFDWCSALSPLKIDGISLSYLHKTYRIHEAINKRISNFQESILPADLTVKR